jgi:hypothetical protein
LQKLDCKSAASFFAKFCGGESRRKSLAVGSLGLHGFFLFAVWRGGIEASALETRL